MKEDQEDGAGLIGQTIPEIAGTEASMNSKCGIYFVGHPGVCDRPYGHDGEHHFVATITGRPDLYLGALVADCNDGSFGEAAYCHHRHHPDEHSTDFDTCQHRICVAARVHANQIGSGPPAS